MTVRANRPHRARSWRLPVVLALLLAALWSVPAAAWWNDQWALRKKITIDTGATGAGVSDPIGTTPILVRLHVGNFRFGSAKEDGGDLRFVASDDKTPLKHHVEKYDSLLGEALVWVAVPDLRPGTKSDIWLYYNSPKVPTAVDAKGTYDADTILVYHFADRGTPAQDTSAWANSAQSVLPGADGSIIGQGARLDGQTALTLPGSPSMLIPEGGAMTWSVWLKMASPQPRAVLYARREGANSLIIGLDNGVPFVEVTNAGSTQRSGEGTAIAAGAWRHLAVTAENGRIALYLDGNPFSSLAATLPTMTGTALIGRDGAASQSAPADPAAAGGSPAPAASPAGDAPQAPATAPESTTPAPAAPAGDVAATGGFVGDIDELQISKVARSPGFIKVAAIGQGPEQAKLISFSVDEETSGWSTGHFGVILQAVTLDGWVVIFFLAIMAVISWVVMVDKVKLLRRTAKGHALFLKHFREGATDLDGLLRLDEQEEAAFKFGGKAPAKDLKAMQTSPLYRVFHLGAQEVRQRFSGDGERRTLSPQAIASIRAVLDSGYVRETQRLNSMMVMLTIAISGGPFLGLLGTVVGVMITFAAIAASGDVNVNAIAPGIAAALVATVAGLAVAIPALFGYNYLLTGIKNTTSDIHVFIDEFVTRMAEAYHKLPDQPLKIAAE